MKWLNTRLHKKLGQYIVASRIINPSSTSSSKESGYNPVTFKSIHPQFDTLSSNKSGHNSHGKGKTCASKLRIKNVL